MAWFEEPPEEVRRLKGRQKLMPEWVEHINELVQQIPNLPPEYVEATKRLVDIGADTGLSPEETSELEGRVRYLQNATQQRHEVKEEPAPQQEKPQRKATRASRVRRGYARGRFRQPRTVNRSRSDEPYYERPDDYERKRALKWLDVEAKKAEDRIFKAHVERVSRMRTNKEGNEAFQEEKRRREGGEVISNTERIRRLNILLRAGMYDRRRARDLMRSEGDTVMVTMTRSSESEEKIPVAKQDLQDWFNTLLPHEKQRLYVIGRKKLDFKFRPQDYPELLPKEGDSAELLALKMARLESEKLFQKEQKRLADALEVVAIPMLQAVFKSLGKNVDIYLTSSNDDIAGGLDVAIDFKKDDGSPMLFSDGSPMRMVLDMTYARMRDKIEKDLARGRISDDAYSILRDRDEEIPRELSNARAMKLFRTLVETMGGTMSTQTFDKNGPLEKPHEHVPRLIIGLDWGNAFAAISNWVEQGDEFEDRFQRTGFGRRIAHSIRNQLLGLHAVTLRDKHNPNTRYLAELIDTLGFEKLETDEGQLRTSKDGSLSNIEQLITRDAIAPRKWIYNRFYNAALAQVEYNREHGGHVRGDLVETQEASAAQPSYPKPRASAKKTATYSGGISLEKNVPPYVIPESPSERTSKLVGEIQAAWERSVINENGERVVTSKNNPRGVAWGEWLSGAMARANGWQDKERAYVRQHWPTTEKTAQSQQPRPLPPPAKPRESAQNQDDQSSEREGNAPATERVFSQVRQRRIREIDAEIAEIDALLATLEKKGESDT